MLFAFSPAHILQYMLFIYNKLIINLSTRISPFFTEDA
ncbi:hypothetical protein RIEGSTA812A_PEG_900 [invertebrate metagenome]|uniref:Uncharacterized protein n=1 Tax=invertebrate metagenome TaxID=1711999 RepID=A0A484H5U0_9ZZZZ